MKNKLLLFLGVLAIVFITTLITSTKSTTQREFVSPNSDTLIVSASTISPALDQGNEKYLESNWNQVELATKLHDYITDYYDIKEIYKDEYPSFYGGMYISDNVSNVVIQIVEENIPDRDSEEYGVYKNIVEMDSSIVVAFVKNSFNELNELNNSISDYMTSDKFKNDNISSTAIDVMDNVVVVDLADDSVKQRNKFEKVMVEFRGKFNSDLISFNQGIYNSSANISAGGKITSGSGGTCSMGLRVKYNNKNGYLTAGHCVNNVGTILPTGTVKVKQYSNNQNYDYAFV